MKKLMGFSVLVLFLFLFLVLFLGMAGYCNASGEKTPYLECAPVPVGTVLFYDIEKDGVYWFGTPATLFGTDQVRLYYNATNLPGGSYLLTVRACDDLGRCSDPSLPLDLELPILVTPSGLTLKVVLNP